MATNISDVLENTTYDRGGGSDSGDIVELAENTVNAGAAPGAAPQAGAADGAAAVIPAVPNGEVAVTIPAGQTVVRVQVAPGETVDLPFDGALAAKLGQGNLAIRSGDQTIILIGYSNANQEGGVTLHDHRGQAIDIAATIAQTDPNLDIQTAAGPAAGPAGAQGGHLFFSFSPDGGLGGFGELSTINATELNYQTIQPDETILVPPPATELTPPTVIVENGSTINEDDLQGRYPQTDEVALLAMPPFGGYGPRQGNDAYDNTDLDSDGIFPEPVSTTIHVTANPGSSPSLALAFNAATIAALEARHLFSENLPLEYNISPDGKTLTAFIVTGEESTLEVFRAEAADGVAQPDGSIKFDITVTLEHSLDNDGSQANVSDTNPNFADDITLDIPFTVSGSGGSAGAEFGVTFRDDTPNMGPTGNLETVSLEAGLNSVSEASEPANIYGSFQFSYGADGEATEGDTFQYGSLAGQKEGPNATFLLTVYDPETGDSGAPLLTIDTRNVAAGSWTDLAATVSSLKSGQENVTIWAYRDGDVTIIEGRTSGDPSVDDSSSGLVFKITAYNHSGFYEADFYAPLGHPDANQTGSDDPLQFDLTATITDGDNDTFSSTQSFQLLDDGPTAVVSADNEISVRIDETAGIDAGTNDAAGDGPFGLGTPLAWGQTAAPVVQTTGTSYGADGAGTESLTLHPSSEGVFSGLYDVQTGFGIYLYQQGANVVGLVGTDASGSASGADPSGALAVAFRLEADGTLDAAEYRALQHSTSTLGDTSEPVHVDTQALQVTLSIADADGDIATSSTGVGNHISFLDDGPTASNFNIGTFTEHTAQVDLGTVDAVFGGHYTSGVDGLDALQGIVLTGVDDPSHGTLSISGGHVFYTPPSNVVGDQTFTFGYQVTDGDGDTAAGTISVAIKDNVPNIIQLTPGGVDLYEAGLPDGSGIGNTATTAFGAFQVDTHGEGLGSLQIGVDTINLAGPFPQDLSSLANAHVTVLSITDVGGLYTVNYSYTLEDADASSGNNGQNLELTIINGVLAIDASGDPATSTVTAHIYDDVPTAQADSRNTNSGAIINGNVEGNDTFGADGKDIVGGVVGVATGSNTAVPVSGSLSVPLVGAYGTLTLNADGSYSYHANPNVSGTDHFVYTIKDGDGDLSTTTLDITVNQVTPTSDTKTVTVDEAALDLTQTGSDLAPGTVTGSNPGLTTETATGALSLGSGVTVVGGLSQTGLFG
ncbi:MAG TPA: DUF5801 repeats-in-toxin domain-containing protein, partial [Terriglobia bacterium]|nr:DUF5801 repeats-in-toxin domain-containing protein [Terriglobia bacterium]